MVDIVMGTCDGTGAAINVCLGFIPDYVKVWNMEDAGNKEPVLEWIKEMAVITQMDEGIKTVGISDTDIDRTVMAADGIAAYAGGDEITYDGTTHTRWEKVSDASDAEEVYVDGHYKRTASGDPAYKCIGESLEPNQNDGSKVKTPAGFTIGADADVNANGEQICWIAMRAN